MGQEERKNKAKLEKTQLQLSTTNNEYESAVKILEETTGRWNREWKAACDVSNSQQQTSYQLELTMIQKFQDLEEERIDFTKSSLWSFANIASTVCVSDDAVSVVIHVLPISANHLTQSCEKVRLSLEDCDVEKDIMTFIKESGTGQEIPEAPKYVNFCRGDTDTMSNASDDENYSVAQFQRTMNPAFRTSSPQPSTLESHHDRDDDHPDDFRRSQTATSDVSAGTTPRKTPKSQHQYSRPQSRQQETHQLVHRDGYPEIPHNEYPPDGMTQFCRFDPPSEVSSAASPQRPSSRDSQSEYSNPTSFSSVDPGSVLSQSPTKQMMGGSDLSMNSEPAHQEAKKRSGFFQSRSPFRRKSKSEKEAPRKGVTPATRNTWGPATNASPTKSYGQSSADRNYADRPSASPEPVDPRANFQLNVGQNVFDVASPDSRRKPPTQSQSQPKDGIDPIQQALADLKGVTKQASIRQSADRYHGIASPGPGAGPNRGSPQKLADRSAPPPSYDGAVSRLGAPQPAFTSRQMQQTTQSYVDQKKQVFNPPSRRPSYDNQQQSSTRTTPQSRPGTSGTGNPPPRATSPSPYRSTSPRPGMYNDQGRAFPPRATSPNPAYNQQSRPRSHSNSPIKQDPPNGYGHDTSPNQMPRATSPRPGYGGSPNGQNEMVLAQPGQQQGGSMGYGAPRGRSAQGTRPVSTYGAPAPQQQHPQQQDNRTRSRSQAAPGRGGSGQFSREGRPVMHFCKSDFALYLSRFQTVLRVLANTKPARAMYTYAAQIPEELSFGKGDVLAILRHQDDGWWEAEHTKKNVRPGLIPSNYMGAV